ncbi:prospero homeobox 3 [Nerophis lumbriciformis]|uniref:prospero homeobox 3 n=1 Tax=Nerophis lumbriciformis TaxID=546530 RepID=UPI002ADF0B12|nr:prospero homeobox protein 1-like isoform X1 [Nerophis lumbriciformis]XP_061817065.1 prospero homeobox protein 1-like isoform X1 [Nerophis lumbriciformis]
MMDSPSDLFDDSAGQLHQLAPPLRSSDLLGGFPGGGRPPLTAFRPPSFPLIQQHLIQPHGAPRRTGGPHHALNPPLALLRGEERKPDEDQDLVANDDQVRKRPTTEWSQELARVKRMKLDGRTEEGEARRGEGGRELRKRRKEELKEQLEEARERLQALQEKVLMAFGEKNMEEEERMFDEEEDDGAGGLTLLSTSPFSNFDRPREEKQKNKAKADTESGGVMEGVGLWLDWDGDMEDEDDDGGQRFAQALKLQLGSAVARVIDRVLRLYTETSDSRPSSPPAAISFLPSGAAEGGPGDKGVWLGLLARVEDEVGGQEERPAGRKDDEREKQRTRTLPPPCSEQTDVALPLVTQKSPGFHKARPLPGPPLSNQANLSLHHPSLPRPPLLSHPLLHPASQSKDPSSSSSSFPPPPPPLPLPLIHYSMQQLFSRSLHHPQMPHLPASRKDFLNSDPFLEFHSHPSFPPLPLLGHLGPALVRGGRERERGVRGGGGMDGGDLYLAAGGTQEGLSPCHLKKAKLMFFYARYPSSNTLKTYFPDVKFNRCVTSQMIKWFSNFREFFYIQMERFARQAVREALARDGAPCLGRESQLRVGRDTELYRILNMHYNKSNIYQVPERFIEVSEVALREFYSAIWTGRDSDPCWKKGIYKIICKLDSGVPDAFRLPGCPVG